MSYRSFIRVFGARQHNLKNINFEIPRGAMTVITGLSGSGKSSLAFDTIYAEGQRKYVESLSAYARQFLERMQRPDVDRIEGLSPTIAIEQRGASAGPRSTVATTTELHDYLRVLFARAGEPHCWLCDRLIERQSIAQIVDAEMSRPDGQRMLILAPLIAAQRGQHKDAIERLIKDGYVRARIDGEVVTLEDVPTLAANAKHTIEVVVDRLIMKSDVRQRVADSVELAARLASGRVMTSSAGEEGQWSDATYNTVLACPVHPEVRLDEISPQLFSFNSIQGACPECHGLGTKLEFDLDLVVPNPNASLKEGAIAAWRRQGRKLDAEYARMIDDYCTRFGFLPDAPFRNLHEAQRQILLHGTSDEDAKKFGGGFEGVMPNLLRRWRTTESESAKERLYAFLTENPCPVCNGARLNRSALCVKIEGRSIGEAARMTIASAKEFVAGLRFIGERGTIAEPLLKELRNRLEFLCEVGVEYLGLDRGSVTLSGGEFQRIRLATQIGGQLSGICYVLDEPTIGLHPRDTKKLSSILKRLASMDNTVIVVEHDEEIMRDADYLIDIGPGAGEAGGNLVASGPYELFIASPNSITARFLRGESGLASPDQRRQPNWSNAIEVHGASANNLKNITVRFPLGCLIAVTGVSGSGKSTLVNQVLLRALRRNLNLGGPKPGAFEKLTGAKNIDRVVEVDQSPIGRTPRSNPATFVGVFNAVRELYAKTREAKIRGYGPNRFSFNVKGGRCEACEGQGVKRIRMHFLPDVFVPCEVCGGTRYNRETLEIRYRGKTIADVLDLSVDESVAFFENFAWIKNRLQALKDVGLGYLRLGQASSTLSGGEAQRVKLAAELHKSAETHIVYILDEPTTGLHFADVRNLLTLLNRLVDRGHTVICIEHNLDVIKCADWVIDLGLEGGDAGGSIVAEGTPETIAGCRASHTGRFLGDRLRPS
ncbi:MAG: excinuclease ABC subunit UvrA [Planctomycetes bacterium]|nr:excinuclease ABC subunit UvrA [Planctomycetota bacterium]MBI3832910.1 excinuclease ABC subunit UvrA [Planctomycetota bacterium]